jgi:hypothetical protein
MKNKWYCYICGKHLGKAYYLVSANESTDRVFLVCFGNKCEYQIEEGYILTKIKEL